MKLLLVEDDPLLGDGLRAALGKNGFTVFWVRDGAAALAALEESADFAAMVLDIGLPGMSGIDVLRTVRANANTIPILMLTARDATRDKVQSLDRGADDYLAKTADMEELTARLRALVRRSGRAETSLSACGLVLDLVSRTATRGGKAIQVSAREFDVLRTLMESAPRIVTRSQIESTLYGWNGSTESNTVEVHIHNLRQKLGPDCIKTVRGVGYAIGKPAQ